MAALDTTHGAFASSGRQKTRVTFLSALMGSMRAWNEARLTRNALYELTDRELDDIGLTRSDIDYVAARRR